MKDAIGVTMSCLEHIEQENSGGKLNVGEETELPVHFWKRELADNEL